MVVTISLPEDISESLKGQWGNVSRHALETIAVEGYRTGALTETQVRRLLGLETRFEIHALLKEHRVPLSYTEADLEEDLAAHRDLSEQRELSAVIVHRAAQFDDGGITDEELTVSASRIFAMLGEEEDAQAR